MLERWRLLVAPNVDYALRMLQEEPVTIVLYDRDTPTINWQQGIRMIVRANPAICLIMLSPVLVEQLRSIVIAGGGYDVTRKPVDRGAIGRIVNGYWALKDSIDAVPQT